MATHHADIMIIGSGPAGYSAGIYGARAGFKTMMIAGIGKGGQLTITTDVDNYPGFGQTIQGPDLMQEMEIQAKRMGVHLMEDHVIEVDFSQTPLRLMGDGGNEYHGRSVIIATGAQARWLGLPSEDQFKGFGVSACATCDGFFFRNQKVAVVGGGNTATEEALYLTKHAHEVLLIHRRDSLRAEDILAKRLLNHEKITPLWNHVVEEIIGEDNPKKVTGIRVKNILDNQETLLTLDGVFVAIGHDPATQIFKGQLELDADGIIRCEAGRTHTNVAGVFAAGDVTDRIYRQAVTAAGMGCMAALDAATFLRDN